MFKVAELLKASGGSLIRGSRDGAVKGISIDSRRTSAGEAFIAIKGDNFDGHDFIGEALSKGAKALIVAKLPLRLRSGQAGYQVASLKKTAVIKVDDTIKALGDITRFKRESFDIPVIAVTGSNGKTTAKEMISWVLAEKYRVLKNEGTKNNHIGLPLALLDLKDKHDIAVLELGTNHFGEIGYLTGICKPNIAVITGIGPSHLEHFRNLKGVFKEKFTLVERLEDPRAAILNADDSLLKKEILRENKKAFILGFGIGKKSDFSASRVKYRDARVEFLVNEKIKFTLETPGYYNIYNALAAIAAGRLFGIGLGRIAKRLAAFDFPAGRLKLITLDKIRFLDDTYNSNPASLKQALNALKNFPAKGRKIFVMGDMLELGRLKDRLHYQAGIEAAKACDAFLTVGPLSGLSAKAAKSNGLGKKPVINCENFRQARGILFNEICPAEEDVVLVKGSRSMRLEGIFKR